MKRIEVLFNFCLCDSIIGAMIIASGFYSIMWGKIKEEDLKGQDGFSSLKSSSTDKIPLLKSCKVQND